LIEAEEEGLEADASRPKIVDESNTARTADLAGPKKIMAPNPLSQAVKSSSCTLPSSRRIPSLRSSRMFLGESPIVSGGASEISLRLTIKPRQLSLDSVGLLQYTWPRHSNILERISKMDVPSTHNLRKAGMFEVLMSDAVAIADAECSPLCEPTLTDKVEVMTTAA